MAWRLLALAVAQALPHNEDRPSLVSLSVDQSHLEIAKWQEALADAQEREAEEEGELRALQVDESRHVKKL